MRKCKLSLNKGHIFFIDNFNRDFPPEIEKLIEYEIYERLRVFVGLIGIPEKKKELKVKNKQMIGFINVLSLPGEDWTAGGDGPPKVQALPQS